MKPLICLLIFLLLAACSTKDSNTYPDISYDPIEKSLSENDIVAYKTFYIADRDTVYIDSIRLNPQGKLLSSSAVFPYPSETRNSYDSLGRITKTWHKSDMGYEYFMKYTFNAAEKEVVETWEHIRNQDTLLFRLNKYKFNDNLDTLRTIVSVYPKGDSSITQFSYTNGRIVELYEKGEVKRLIKYVYETHGLHQIKHYQDNKLMHVDYISPFTGLIDSTINDNNYVVYYKYY